MLSMEVWGYTLFTLGHSFIDVFNNLNARDRLVLIDGPDRLPYRRNNRRRGDCPANHDAARLVHALVRLLLIQKLVFLLLGLGQQMVLFDGFEDLFRFFFP